MRSMYGRAYETIGSTDSDLVLITKGQVKVQIGNTSIDLITDNKLNIGQSSGISQVSTISDVGTIDGFYYIRDTGSVIAVVNGLKVETLTNGLLSYTLQQILSTEQKNIVLTNIGLVGNNIKLINGIYYSPDSNAIYANNNNVLQNMFITFNNQKLNISSPTKVVASFDESGLNVSNITTKNITVDSITLTNSVSETSKYLSKLTDDSALGFITFAKGLDARKATIQNLVVDKVANIQQLLSDSISSSNFIHDVSGYGITNNAYSSTIEADYLIARKKFTTTTLEVNKVEAITGNKIFTDAGNEITRVEVVYLDSTQLISGILITGTVSDSNKYYRCYIKSIEGTDKEIGLTNYWKVDDLARCQDFDNNSSRYYWRQVCYAYSKNTTVTIDSVAQQFDTDWILLSYTDCDTSLATRVNNTIDYTTIDFPITGDNIVQLGNKTNIARQNAIAFIINDDYAPAIMEYKGINDYTLQDKVMTQISPELGDVFKAKSFEVIIGNDKSDWNNTTIYRINDRVLYQSIWYLCIKDTVDEQNQLLVETPLNQDGTLNSIYWKSAQYIDLSKQNQLFADNEQAIVRYDSTSKKYNLQFYYQYRIKHIMNGIQSFLNYSDINNNYSLVITAYNSSSTIVSSAPVTPLITTDTNYFKNGISTIQSDYYTLTSDNQVSYFIVTLQDSLHNIVDSRLITVSLESQAILSILQNEIKLSVGKVGIDLDTETINLTANQFNIKDTSGNPIAVFTIDAQGNPVLKTANIDTTNITALGHVTAGSFNIGNGKFIIDENGNMTAVNANINGVVKSQLFYSPIRITHENGYIINPPAEPYHTFYFNHTGSKIIYLPSAASFDGIEFQFFYFKTTTTFDDNLWVGAPTNEHIWANNSSNVIVQVSSVNIVPNLICTIKSMNGTWIVVSGSVQ